MPMTAPLAFITGASSGIGQALAAQYLRKGFRLALVARRTTQVEDWLRGQPGGANECAVYAADVRDIPGNPWSCTQANAAAVMPGMSRTSAA